MKKTIFEFLSLVFLLTTIQSCDDKTLNGPLENDGTAPGPITGPVIESIPGGGRIIYDLPGDPDLFYVKAEYVPYPGIQRTAKSSYYTNSIEVAGFGDTLSHEVKLYAVDRSENESEPVVLNVKPNLPSFLKIRKSVSLQADFGGIRVRFENPDTINAVIIVSTIDENGDFTVSDSHYTSASGGTYKIIGYDTEERTFAAYVWDQGYHRSDTLIAPISPYHEEELDQSRFQEVLLPGDVTMAAGRPISNMWDNDLVTNGHTSMPTGGDPMWFTFDLGVTAQLSRFVIHTYPHPENYFNAQTMRRYEIWGSTDPNPDGSWDDSWTKLLTHENTKPSGLPLGQLSNDDIAAAEAGDSGDFPLDIPPIRYVRIKCLYNWSAIDNTNFLISEMKFWGSPQ